MCVSCRVDWRRDDNGDDDDDDGGGGGDGACGGCSSSTKSVDSYRRDNLIRINGKWLNECTLLTSVLASRAARIRLAV